MWWHQRVFLLFHKQSLISYPTFSNNANIRQKILLVYLKCEKIGTLPIGSSFYIAPSKVIALVFVASLLSIVFFFSCCPLWRARKSDNFRYRLSWKSNNFKGEQYTKDNQCRTQIQKKSKEIKSDNFRNRKKSDN